MTKKRFVETVSTGIVTDNITGKEYNCDVRIDEELLELLNMLYEENVKLKRAYMDAKSDVENYEQILKDIILDNFLIQDLKKECK